MKIECRVNFNPESYQQANLSEAYAMEAYAAISAFYPTKDASIIKENSKLTENRIQIDGFLANALFTGKDSYSLVPGLTNSPKAKTSEDGNKYLHVRVKDEFKTVTEKSEGWKHPGFIKEFYEEWKNYCDSLEILELIFSKQ